MNEDAHTCRASVTCVWNLSPALESWDTAEQVQELEDGVEKGSSL